MPTRQEIRSEETRRAMLDAAGGLFAERGFDTVTMREIAKAAGCSHTTIYIYFKDKEALLHQLSMGPLQALYEQMEGVLANDGLCPEERLRLLSRTFVEFCLANRTMYSIFFMVKAVRVDEQDPAMEVNRLRNQLFGLLRRAVQQFLAPGLCEETVLAYARICFFTLHGIIGTYTASEEPMERLMERLSPTFDLALDVMLAGLKQTAERGVERS